MGGLHPQHDIGLLVEAGQQLRPEEFVLGAVVEVQGEAVVAQMVDQDPAAGPVAGLTGGDQFRQQPRLPAEHPVDDDHLMGVDGG